MTYFDLIRPIWVDKEFDRANIAYKMYRMVKTRKILRMLVSSRVHEVRTDKRINKYLPTVIMPFL